MARIGYAVISSKGIQSRHVKSDRRGEQESTWPTWSWGVNRHARPLQIQNIYLNLITCRYCWWVLILPCDCENICIHVTYSYSASTCTSVRPTMLNWVIANRETSASAQKSSPKCRFPNMTVMGIIQFVIKENARSCDFSWVAIGLVGPRQWGDSWEWAGWQETKGSPPSSQPQGHPASTGLCSDLTHSLQVPTANTQPTPTHNFTVPRPRRWKTP